MENIFTEKELLKAREIVTAGLVKAARSLGVLINSETTFEFGEEFSISESFSPSMLTKVESTIYLLSTNLMGELKGVSFLLFSEEEVKEIMKSCYPNKQFDDEKYKRKSESLILEVDNIITAGVVSEFANAFNSRTFGGVPKLDVLNLNQAIHFISKETSANNFILKFKTMLISETMNIKADFLWSLDSTFIDAIKESVQSETKA